MADFACCSLETLKKNIHSSHLIILNHYSLYFFIAQTYFSYHNLNPFVATFWLLALCLSTGKGNNDWINLIVCDSSTPISYSKDLVLFWWLIVFFICLLHQNTFNIFEISWSLPIVKHNQNHSSFQNDGMFFKGNFNWSEWFDTNFLYESLLIPNKTL